MLQHNPRTGKTVDDLVSTLADEIVHRRLPPGTYLDEGSLAARFGVSRTPVREALRELSAMGLVERPPNRRATVTKISDERLHAMFETMAELEAVTAQLAATRMSEQERSALSDIHRKSAQLVRTHATEEYKDYNAFFHRLIYAGCHNDHLADLVTATKLRLSPFRRAQFELGDRLDASWSEHNRIVAAILARDGALAATEARKHVLNVSVASASLIAPQAQASDLDEPARADHAQPSGGIRHALPWGRQVRPSGG